MAFRWFIENLIERKSLSFRRSTCFLGSPGFNNVMNHERSFLPSRDWLAHMTKLYAGKYLSGYGTFFARRGRFQVSRTFRFLSCVSCLAGGRAGVKNILVLHKCSMLVVHNDNILAASSNCTVTYGNNIISSNRV